MPKSHTACGSMLKQINDILEKNANNALRNQDLTLTQIGMLVELDNIPSKSATFKDLERIFNVAQPTIVGIIKRLEQKELVETLPDSTDKRIKLAHLTQKGQKKCLDGYEHMNAAENQLLHSLTKTEQNEFSRLLEKVLNSLQ